MSPDLRKISILSTIVEEYISSALPVGSRTVSKKSHLDLSAASIRNIMADLTEEGYLQQPHTSAGRIPTPKGFRLYLDSCLKLAPLSGEKQKNIARNITDAGTELSALLRQTSKLLSSLADQVSMVLTPSQNMIRWQQIDFVLLRPGLIASILVLEGGLIKTKNIDVDKKITSDDLVKYSNYLNQLFQGRTIFQARRLLMEQMELARKQLNSLCQAALNLARESFEAENGERELYVDGTVKLLDQPEFSDMNTMKGLLSLLEERSRLLAILDKTLEEGGVSIVFGLKDKEDDSELESCCLISSPYLLTDETAGVIGIIGPIRMNYSRVLPVVDFTAQVLSQVLKSRF